MRIDFSGKAAVVTGGASGIGLAIANALREAGADVHVFDLQSEPSVNVADSGSVERAFSRVPTPDVVVVNAGTVAPAELPATTDEIWLRTITTNLTGAFYTVR